MRSFLLLAAALLFVGVFAQENQLTFNSEQTRVVVTPTPNIFSETFDANPGYDPANSWTEAADGATLDEDDTTNPPLTSTGFTTQQFEMAMTTDNNPTNTISFSAQAGYVYCRAYIYVADESLGDGVTKNIIKIDVADGFSNGSGFNVISLRQTAGQLELIMSSGDNVAYTENISAGAVCGGGTDPCVYRVEWMGNNANGASELRINGTPIDTPNTGTDPGENPTRLRIGFNGDPAAGCGGACTNRIFIDGLACGDNGWLGA